MLVHDENEEDYSVKVGRWKRDALDAVQDLGHWRQMHILSVARGPAMHLMNFIQKEAGFAKGILGHISCAHTTYQ